MSSASKLKKMTLKEWLTYTIMDVNKYKLPALVALWISCLSGEVVVAVDVELLLLSLLSGISKSSFNLYGEALEAELIEDWLWSSLSSLIIFIWWLLVEELNTSSSSVSLLTSIPCDP